MHMDHARDGCVPLLNGIKADLFQHDPDIPIILHRTDIIGKKGPFGVLRDQVLRATFDARILSAINLLDYAVITAVINKQEMMAQHHWNEQHPYHYLMGIIVEKYVQWLERKNSTGDIMPEERKGKKDLQLQAEFDRVRLHGTEYVGADRIRTRLPASKLKFRCKRDNIAGLQLCDLIAHPSYIYARHLHGDAVQLGAYATQVSDILVATKYDRSWNGRIRGYGIKYLP